VLPALGDAPQRGRQLRRVDVQRVTRFDRSAARIGKRAPQRRVGQQASELLDPLVFSGREEPIDAILMISRLTPTAAAITGRRTP
jgi:hypothetical protein